jgi:hypothetical protein
VELCVQADRRRTPCGLQRLTPAPCTRHRGSRAWWTIPAGDGQISQDILHSVRVFEAPEDAIRSSGADAPVKINHNSRWLRTVVSRHAWALAP